MFMSPDTDFANPYEKEIAQLEDNIASLKKKLAATEDPIRRYAMYEEALTASPETKFAFNGEFHFYIDVASETGEPYSQKVTVPWTTVKDIMKAIKTYANLNM